MGDSIGSGVFLFFAIYFACLYEFFVDMPVFFTSFFSINFIISMSEYKKDADAAVPLSDFKASYTLQRTMMTADTHVNRLYITHLLRIC